MTTHLPREMYLESISFLAAWNCFYLIKIVKSKKRSGWEMVLTFSRVFKNISDDFGITLHWNIYRVQLVRGRCWWCRHYSKYWPMEGWVILLSAISKYMSKFHGGLISDVSICDHHGKKYQVLTRKSKLNHFETKGLINAYLCCNLKLKIKHIAVLCFPHESSMNLAQDTRRKGTNKQQQ